MTKPLDIAELYFELSNKSDFDGIESLFTDSTKYISANTGEYAGKANIMDMQKEFHNKFSSLKWKVNSVKELGSDTILFDYNFSGTLPSGEKVESSGLEYVTVKNGKIEKVKIQNKT